MAIDILNRYRVEGFVGEVNVIAIEYPGIIITGHAISGLLVTCFSPGYIVYYRDANT